MEQSNKFSYLPLVTVLMPVYNSRLHLKEAIASIQRQTYGCWELLVINEFGSDDGSAQLVAELSLEDSRICLIQNERRLGLAESLNVGLRLARGKYIARMDADDISHDDRLEKQVQFMEAHPEISLCGSWQHHFGPSRDWIHRPPSSPEECKANLLFDCDLCHSTLMLRRKDFIENNLFYNPNYLAEDFELWSRAVGVIKIANIPEVLGEYRWDGENISLKKLSQMAKEHAIIVADGLKRNLGIQVNSEDYELLEGWKNPFYEQSDKNLRREMYRRFQVLLTEIYHANLKRGFYDDSALLSILAARWRYARYMEPRNVKRNVHSLEEIFNPHYIPNFWLIWKEYRGKNMTAADLFQKAKKYLKNRI